MVEKERFLEVNFEYLFLAIKAYLAKASTGC